jgi:hypothetical protein
MPRYSFEIVHGFEFSGNKYGYQTWQSKGLEPEQRGYSLDHEKDAELYLGFATEDEAVSAAVTYLHEYMTELSMPDGDEE